MSSAKELRGIVLSYVFKDLLKSKVSEIEGESLLPILDALEIARRHIESDERFTYEYKVGVADHDDLIALSFEAQSAFNDSMQTTIKKVYNYIKSLPNAETRPIDVSRIEPGFNAAPYIAQLILIGKLSLSPKGVQLASEDQEYLDALKEAQAQYSKKQGKALASELFKNLG